MNLKKAVVIDTYHIACTETGLKTWTLLTVDTLKPLMNRIQHVQSEYFANVVFKNAELGLCVHVMPHPSPSKCISVSLHKGRTSPTVHVLQETHDVMSTTF